jgi:hypothetical protein
LTTSSDTGMCSSTDGVSIAPAQAKDLFALCFRLRPRS